VSETIQIDCRAEAARCLSLAQGSNDPYIRRTLIKIADSYTNLAQWIEGEIASGRRSAQDR
jgi:hypothetical protein